MAQIDDIQERPEGNSGIGVLQILEATWRQRIWFIIPVFVSLVFAILFTLLNTRNSIADVYSYNIQFNFSRVEKLEYPNGETFALQDIIAPHVLDEVYQSEIAGKFDVPAQRFRQNFRISAYSPTRELIIARYDNLLSNRRISFAESASAGQELEAALNAASRNAAVVSFQNNTLNLPPAVVKASLEKVVQAWIRYSVDKRGVLEINVDVLEPSFLNEQFLTGLGQASQLAGVVEMYNKVLRYVSVVSKLEGAGGLVDQQSGFTLSSVQSQLATLEGRIINLARRWSQTSTESGTSLSGMYSDNAFNSASLEGLDPQVAFDVLLDRINDIRSNITLIESFNSGAAVADPDSGLTVVDLGNTLSEIEVYQIKTLRDAFLQSGVSKNPLAVRAYYEQRIREYERKRDSIAALAKVIENVDKRYENASSADAGVGPGIDSSQNVRAPSISQQFGDGFLDRIIAMSSQADDTKFRQELARKSIDLLGEVADINNKIGGLKSDLEIFEAGRTAGSTEGVNLKEEDASARISNILKDLSRYLGITVKIGRRIKKSDDFTKILVDDLNLNADDPRLSRSSFLDTGDSETVNISSVLGPLRELIAVTNRINSQLSDSLYGARSLAASLGEPEREQESLVNRRSILLFSIITLIGFLLGTLLTISKVVGSGIFRVHSHQAQV